MAAPSARAPCHTFRRDVSFPRNARETGNAHADAAAASMAGAMLAIKPVIAIVDGEVAILGKARGSKNGKNMLNQNIEASGGIDFRQPLALGYTGLSRDLLDKYIEDSRGLWEESVKSLLVYPVGCAIGTHVGPGAIALAYFCKGRD